MTESRITVQRILILLSVISFILAIFNVPLPDHQMLALGLAFFAAGHLV